MANELPNAWWKDITFDELAQASGVIARFQALVSTALGGTNEVARSPIPSANQVARAIVLRRLVSDDSALEGLVDWAATVHAELLRAVVADRDLRGVDRVLVSRRSSQALMPVLSLCGQMLRSRSGDGTGKDAVAWAEKLREVLFDYNLLDFRYGVRSEKP